MLTPSSTISVPSGAHRVIHHIAYRARRVAHHIVNARVLSLPSIASYDVASNGIMSGRPRPYIPVGQILRSLAGGLLADFGISPG